MQDAGAQQVELCSTVHLTLQELQSVDLALNLPAAPRRLEGCPHRRMIRREAGCEAANLGSFTVPSSGQPSVEAIDIASVNQSQELTGQAACLGDLRLDGAQGLDESTMFGALWHLLTAFVPTHQPSVGALRRRSGGSSARPSGRVR